MKNSYFIILCFLFLNCIGNAQVNEAEIKKVLRDGDLPKFEKLLSNGLDPNKILSDGDTLIVLTSRLAIRPLPFVNALTKKGASQHKRGRYGDTVLIAVLKSDMPPDKNYVEYLLEEKFSPYEKNEENLNAITIARNKDLKEIVDLFSNIKKIRGDYDWPPVIIAAQNKNFNALKELIESDKNALNVQDNYGLTPLMRTLKNRDMKSVEYLLGKECRLNLKDIYGNSALDYAIIFFTKEHSLTLIKAMIQKNADINIINNSGYSPIHYAARSMNEELIDFLIAAGASINLKAKTNNEETPLALAIRSRASLDFVKKMVERGADTKEKSVLAEAVIRKDKLILNFLNIKDKEIKY